MSKKFFRCVACGPLKTEDIVVHSDYHLMECPTCGANVMPIREEWESEPMSEKARAFLFVSAVAFVAITLAVVIRRILGA